MASRQCGLVSIWQAERFGVSARTLQRRAQTGGWERLQTGVYALPGVAAGYRRDAMAAVLRANGRTHDENDAAAGALVARRSAARVLGLTQTRPYPLQMVTADVRKLPRLRKTRPQFSGSLLPVDRSLVDGVPVTSTERTLCDLAWDVGEPELIEMTATAIQRRLAVPAGILARAEAFGRLPGIGRLRGALAQLEAQGRTDSALERRIRDYLVEVGLPPFPGLYPLTVDGRLVAWLDIAYPQHKVVVEVDGYCWHSLPSDMRNDHVRENWLKAYGWVPLRIGMHEFDQSRDRFLTQLQMVLASR